MGALKNYEPMDLDAQEDLDAEFAAGGASEFAKLKVGKNVFRFLPKQKGQKSHMMVVHEHFVDDVPNMKGTFRFACPRRHANQHCPECEKADRMRKSDNPIDRQSAKGHYPVSRIYANVIDRHDEDAGPKILTFGKQIKDQLRDVEKDKAEGGDYTDPTEEGFDIIITRVGTGQYDTEYTVRPARGSCPLSDDDDEAEEWIDQQWQLANYTDVMEPVKLLAALKGERYSRQALPSGRGGRRRTAQDDLD